MAELSTVEPSEVRTLRIDAVAAAEVRAALEPLLQEACRLLDKAKRDGLTVGFSLPVDAHGRYRYEISVVKPL